MPPTIKSFTWFTNSACLIESSDGEISKSLQSLVISFAQQTVKTILTASFDHQALSEIYCSNKSSFISCSESELLVVVNSYNWLLKF